MPRKQGKFIVFEGPEGSGKSTQIRQLAAYLKRKNQKLLVTREPGGTDIGERIRRLLLNRGNHKMHVRTELLLYMSARAQLIEQVIRPARKAGTHVLSDRFLMSSVVYQGIAGGLDVDTILKIGRFATAGIMPDSTFFLDLPAEQGFARGVKRPDRMESKGMAFHRKVRRGFRRISQTDTTYHLIDARRSIEEVARRIREKLDGVL